MFYKVFNEIGDYVDAKTKEQRNLLEVEFAMTPDGLNYDWVELENLKAAITYFDLEVIND